MSKHGVKIYRFRLDDDSLTETGSFRGYASIWNVVDSQGDIVEKGAFRKTLKEKKNGRVKLLWSHDAYGPPIGYVAAAEDEHGLAVEGQLFLDANAKAREAYAAAMAGVLDGLSIGYKTIKDSMDRSANVRRLKELELYEVSLCNFQACPGAVVTGVKSLDALAGCVEELRGESLDEEQKTELVNQIESLKALLLGTEPPPAGTPSGQEPPVDSGLGPVIEAAQALVQTTRAKFSVR